MYANTWWIASNCEIQCQRFSIPGNVELAGQEALGDPSELFTDREQGVLSATKVVPVPEYLGDAGEDPGTRISWRAARISGWVGKDALASGMEPARDFAKAAYENECARCHTVFAPSNFKAVDWEHSIKNMRRFTGLSNKDLDLVLGYLQRNGKGLAEF